MEAGNPGVNFTAGFPVVLIVYYFLRYLLKQE